MLKIDTEAMKQMVSLVQAANEELDSVADLTNRIVNHHDWNCWERTQINESISASKNAIKILQESNRGFFNVIKQVLDEFIQEEKNIGNLFHSVESALGLILSTAAIGAGAHAISNVIPGSRHPDYGPDYIDKVSGRTAVPIVHPESDPIQIIKSDKIKSVIDIITKTPPIEDIITKNPTIGSSITSIPSIGDVIGTEIPSIGDIIGTGFPPIVDFKDIATCITSLNN